MEELQNALQFWKSFGYYGGALAVAIGGVIGLISYYKTSDIEKLIRTESSKADSLARNEFLDRMDIQFKQQQAIQEAQEKLLKNKTLENAEKTKTTKSDRLKPEDNFRYEIDAQDKLIKFWPKVGEWKKPIIAYPSDENDVVKGKFTSQTGMMFMVMEGTNDEHKLTFFVASGGPAASEDNFYGLQYEFLPSYVVIGDDGIAMWRIDLNKVN